LRASKTRTSLVQEREGEEGEESRGRGRGKRGRRGRTRGRRGYLSDETYLWSPVG
jgi:hypothetical protein